MNVWMYWHDWNEMPDYISQCVEIAEKRVGPITRLDKVNLFEYLYEGACFTAELIHHRAGGIHTYAVRSDYIRVKILQKYGGIWLDPDTIVLNPLLKWKVEALLNDFVYYRDPNGLVPVGFMASAPKGKIISEYSARQDDLISQNKVFKSELGSRLLTLIINELGVGTQIARELVCPIDFRERIKFYQLSEPDIPEDALCVQLYNRVFKKELHDITPDMMVSRLIQRELEKTHG